MTNRSLPLHTPPSRRTVLKGLAMTGVGLTVGGPLLAACSEGATSGSGDSGPITVGAIVDLTGAFGIVGNANQAIAKFAVDEINSAGGVLGRQLSLKFVDGASDPATWAKVATQLVTEDQVSMVIGETTSAEREAVKTIIAERGQTLYICPASYEGGECTDNVWTCGAVPNQQVDPTVDYLLQRGAKTFYLCGNDYSYPQNVLKAARARIEAGGGQVVGEDYIPVSATDAPNLVSKTLASGADAVFEVVVLPATVPYIQGIIEGGYKGLIASTLFDQVINPLLGADAAGLISTQDFYPGAGDSFSQQKYNEFTAKYPKVPFGATVNSPAWYRGLYLWKTAVEKAGSLDLQKVNTAMDSVAYSNLIGGPARFVPGAKHCELTMYLGKMQASGGVVPLKNLGSIQPAGQCS